MMRDDDWESCDGEEGEESDRQAAAADALTVCAVKDVEGGITADESVAGNVVIHVVPKSKSVKYSHNIRNLRKIHPLPRFRCCF